MSGSASADTGKTFVTLKVVEMLKNKRTNYLLLAPTGVAAQNVSGKTIHSTLKIRQTGNNYYQTLFATSEVSIQVLLQIKAIIIDEISMISRGLF